MSKKTIGIMVGSLRRDSYSKKVAKFIGEQLEDRYTLLYLDIAPLVMYNQDLDNEENLPQEWRRFREEVKSIDAILFVTPEYNRSIPPVLKNALDIASRPTTDNAWNEKPGAIVSVTPGSIGGFGASNHLRQSAACLNIHMMQVPEAYIGGITASVDDDGVSNQSLKDFLSRYADAFSSWVERF
ncbi:MAG: NAD(P)H-dependent oxidoreductase [Oscillospiraceae bacterium]|nr:NAD(P)H-dependent oxidoreductase [Oscillospiraceae bacterium]